MLTAGRRITRLAAAVTILGLGSNACTGETTGSSEANFSDRYLASLIGAADSHENEEVMTDYLRYEEASISHCMDEAGFEALSHASRVDLRSVRLHRRPSHGHERVRVRHLDGRRQRAGISNKPQ